MALREQLFSSIGQGNLGLPRNWSPHLPQGCSTHGTPDGMTTPLSSTKARTSGGLDLTSQDIASLSSIMYTPRTMKLDPCIGTYLPILHSNYSRLLLHWHFAASPSPPPGALLFRRFGWELRGGKPAQRWEGPLSVSA